MFVEVRAGPIMADVYRVPLGLDVCGGSMASDPDLKRSKQQHTYYIYGAELAEG